MPKLAEIEISYEQIADLVCQLEFEEKMNLIKILCEKEYKDKFYSYTEGLKNRYQIPEMNEEELDRFLHEQG